MTPKSLLAPARLAGRPVLRSQSDERLVDLVRAGSEPAFEAIVARYRGPLLRYCRRILSEPRAEDAVQQAFLSAFGAIRAGDTHIDLRPWLYRIAHNCALNALRDRGLRHAELDERIDGVERPDQALARRQSLRDVVAAVQALPERQRDAIVLRELEGRSYEEIAGTLGVSGGAVRQLLNRARNALRASVTAVTPLPLMVRLWSSGGDPSGGVGELVGAGGAGALATKLAATALVTGAVAGGIAVAPHHHRRDAGKSADPGARNSGSPRAAGRHDAGAAGVPADHSSSARSGHGTDGEHGGGDHRGSSSGDGHRSGGDDRTASSDGRGSGHDGARSGSRTSGSEGPGSGGSTVSGSGELSSGRDGGSGSVDGGSGGDRTTTSGSSDGGSSGSGGSHDTTTTTPLTGTH